MSRDGYISCVTAIKMVVRMSKWDFTDHGLRNTLPLEGRFGLGHGNHTGPPILMRSKILKMTLEVPLAVMDSFREKTLN